MKKQQLTNIVKRARNIMRKDAGLSTDVDRIPQLSWILFLKFFDDLEIKNKALNSKYRPVIENPYRWRDWASNDEGTTGTELIKFINDKLFPHLRELKGSKENDPRDVLASIFAETYNRMLSGYLLREIINLVDEINFQSKDDIFTLSHLYESMLKKMRDAAGTNGEFYTPRPVVRFIIEHIKPKIGERILDPACGTGGFLVEAYEYMKKQANTSGDYDILQYKTLYGIEKKPMPYLLGTMNLMLHGIETPNIQRRNTLATPLKEITEKDKYDVIITNPPFGGEEEKSIQSNFPMSMRTAETALLFIQFIVRSLRVNGRAAVIVPNGFMFVGGVAAKVRQLLCEDCNLKVVIRLPKGVFEPYADIPTNILIFTKSGPSKTVNYYNHPLPSDRAKLKTPCYTLQNPLRFKEFEPLLSWIKKPIENEQGWFVDANKIRAKNYSLDFSHPNKHQSEKIDIQELFLGIKTQVLHFKEQDLSFDDDSIKIKKLSRLVNSSSLKITTSAIGDVCSVLKGKSSIKRTVKGKYPLVVTATDRKTSNHYDFDVEAVCVPMVSSTGHGHASIKRIHYQEGKFALANILAVIIPLNTEELLTKYLYYYLKANKEKKLVSLMKGTANTSLTLTKLKNQKISYPDVKTQEEIVNYLDVVSEKFTTIHSQLNVLSSDINGLKEKTIITLLRN